MSIAPDIDNALSDDGAPDQQVFSWARPLGYQADAGGLGRRHRRKNVFSRLADLPEAVPQPDAPRQAPARVEPVVAGPPLQIDVSDPGRIKLEKALKGSDEKKTCIVSFHGKSLVVKGGSGDSVDHVVATEFIGRLDLKGVRVAASRSLTDPETRALVTLFSAGGAHARDLATALGRRHPDTGATLSQLSEMADGVAPDKAFLDDSNSQWQDEDIERHVDVIAAGDKDASWTKLYEQVLAGATKTALLNLKNHLKPVTAAEKAAAILVARAKCGANNLQLMLDLLEAIESDTVKAGLDKATAHKAAMEISRAEIKKFSESPAGVEAYAGVAAADLVSGMDDRILGKSNGGNFLFDVARQELVCVDNSKNSMRSLTAPDQGAWRGFVSTHLGGSSSLEDAIYERIYGKGESSSIGDPSAPGNYVVFNGKQAADAREIIRKTLAKVVADIEKDPDQNPEARERVKFIKARMQVDVVFKALAALPDPPSMPAKLDKTDKLKRAGKSFFTANKKDQRNDTARIKKDLREGRLTAEQARAELATLEAANPKLQSDQRSKKIEYLAAVAEYCETIEAAAARLALLKQPELKGLLTTSSTAALLATLGGSLVKWRAAMATDKKTLPRFDSAWKTFHDGLPA